MDNNHINKIIDLLYHEVMSAGGDGDAIWYSKYYKVKDLLPLVKEYNSKLKWPWGIVEKETSIFWGLEQEWVIITNNESMFTDAPSWTQFLLKN